MAKSFALQVTDIETLKQAKNVTLHYDEDGVLQQYAINQTLPVASVATGLIRFSLKLKTKLHGFTCGCCATKSSG